MTFEELYDKVIDIDCNGNYGSLNVAVSYEYGYKIVKDISVETSLVDNVGKFVLIKCEDD